jgi:hypothetical protein
VLSDGVRDAARPAHLPFAQVIAGRWGGVFEYFIHRVADNLCRWSRIHHSSELCHRTLRHARQR